MKKILIKNIAMLLYTKNEEGQIHHLKNAWLALEADFVQDYGEMIDFPGITDWQNLTVVDADNMAAIHIQVEGSHAVIKDCQPGKYQQIGLLPIEKAGQTLFHIQDFSRVFEG